MTRNCVIAGVGPGNGASFARRFSAAGYRVAMLARNEEYLNELSGGVSDSYAIGCDVRDPEMVCKAFQRVHNELGSVDLVLVNGLERAMSIKAFHDDGRSPQSLGSHRPSDWGGVVERCGTEVAGRLVKAV